jgi:hypothetical protein
MLRKRIIFSFVIVILTLISIQVRSQAIVADHTIVDKYKEIPPFYLNKVKEMWTIVAGESHASGYRIGCKLLNQLDTAFKSSSISSGTPEAYTSKYLRLNGITWGDVSRPTGWVNSYGEEDWFTSPAAISRTENHLAYCTSHALSIAAMGFGWCWDMTADNSPGGTVDPVYKVRWAGRSAGGPQGSMRWGIDSGDSILTGNSVCMDTYLAATVRLMDYCKKNGYSTKIFFTTGPVDGSSNLNENGYQRHLKHNHIRNFVKQAPDRILFDYADILCWNNAGQESVTTWKDGAGITQTFQFIHPENMLDLDGNYAEDGDHIGQKGAVRLAKAMWWMLARMAGWNGVSTGNEIELTTGKEIRMYPNPTNHTVKIEIPSLQSGASAIVYDLQGRIFINQRLEECSTQLNINQLTNGIYFVKINSGEEEVIKKIVVVR